METRKVPYQLFTPPWVHKTASLISPELEELYRAVESTGVLKNLGMGPIFNDTPKFYSFIAAVAPGDTDAREGERAGLAATVISYRARSAVRDVGKAMGLSEDTVSGLAGMVWGTRPIPGKGGGVLPEKHVREAGLDPADPRLARVLELSEEIMGFPRHLSQHVGGFVLTRGPLSEAVPIGNAAMAERTFIEWDKDDLDALGLLKVDVLGLGMLEHGEVCKRVRLVRQHSAVAQRITARRPECQNLLVQLDCLLQVLLAMFRGQVLQRVGEVHLRARPLVRMRLGAIHPQRGSQRLHGNAEAHLVRGLCHRHREDRDRVVHVGQCESFRMPLLAEHDQRRLVRTTGFHQAMALGVRQLVGHQSALEVHARPLLGQLGGNQQRDGLVVQLQRRLVGALRVVDVLGQHSEHARMQHRTHCGRVWHGCAQEPQRAARVLELERAGSAHRQGEDSELTVDTIR